MAGRFEELSGLINEARSFEINMIFPTGLGLVHYAVLSDDADFITFISSKQGNLNISTPQAKPPLIFATELQHWKSASILLDLGADPTLFDDDGMTALMIASRNGFLPIVKRLVEAFHVNINYSPPNNLSGFNAVHHAILGNQASIVEYFFQLPPNKVPNVFLRLYCPFADEFVDINPMQWATCLQNCSEPRIFLAFLKTGGKELLESMSCNNINILSLALHYQNPALMKAMNAFENGDYL